MHHHATLPLPHHIAASVLAACAALSLAGTSHAAPVSFRNEVMAVLSRGGCNAGACHGNQNGKNGFKLSLRGQDPDFDFNALTRDTLGRRTDRIHVAESLLLTKPTATVPHEGGKRFGTDSPEYDILRRWIGEGLKPDPDDAPRLLRLEVSPAKRVLVEPDVTASLKVTAFFSDGRSRDVTRLSVFDPSNLVARVSPDGSVERLATGETAILVRYLDHQVTAQLAFVPARPGFVWHDPPTTNDIDKHVFAKLQTLRIQPSELCAASVFVRRAYLDTVGLLPTADEARRFLADERPDKRARLIDELLDRPEFADFWALKWSDLLRNEEKVLDRKGVALFHDWIRRSILENKPFNEFARELIAARGSSYSNPPANYYRALRDPQTRAEATAQVFLGVRLQCARCHNHPFERWTQNDYHSLAAFFCRVDYRIVENNRKDRLDLHEFDGEQIIYQDRQGEVTHPRTHEVLKPHFLGADTPDFAPDADRLEALADWIARPDNPFFARAQVNRVWAHLLGRGIVDPIDDFRASNPPVNEPLLDFLSRDFVKHRFDLKHLVRTIMNSRTYQLSAVPNDNNRDDETNFSHAQVRSLQAEQLYDALTQVIGIESKFPGFPTGTHAGQLPGVTISAERRKRVVSDMDKFMTTFGKPVRSLSCECERSDDTTLNQAFQLITGELLNKMLAEPDNRLGRLLSERKTTPEILDEVYLAALSRPPSPKERPKALELINRAKDRRTALEDVLWGLVNAKEFLLRQ
jgi:hypothetical protein